MARLSYVAYVLHFPLMTVMYSNPDTSHDLTYGYIHMTFLYYGIIVYLLSIVINLMSEMPFNNLERLLIFPAKPKIVETEKHKLNLEKQDSAKCMKEEIQKIVDIESTECTSNK